MNRRSLIVAAAAVLGAAAVGPALHKFISGRSTGAFQLAWSATQEQVSQSNSVAALGRIEPASEIINIGGGPSPDRLESLYVERGDLVKRGEVIGYLSGYAGQVAQQDLLRTQLYEAKARLKTETALNHLRVKEAELNRRRVLELSPHRIAAQEATVASLEARQSNENDVRAAQARLAELRQEFELDKLNADVQIELARATLDRVQAQFPLTSLERQIALAEMSAKRMTLYAPCDCRVLNIRVKPGEAIGSGPVVSLGDTRRMRAVAEVYETDIAKVRVGQKALVSSRALAKSIGGTVAQVGAMIFKNDVLNVDPAARADARIVQVWIDLDDSAAVERLTNLTVDVLIATSQPARSPPRP